LYWKLSTWAVAPSGVSRPGCLRIVGHPVSFDGTTLTGLPGDLTLV
jgi:hypothetical protein